MPLLGALFNRRNASSRRGPSTATESVASSSTSNRDSTDGDYVLPDRSLPPPQPMYNLPAAASSGKLRLPFRRKAPVPRLDPKDTSHSVVSLNDVPSPPYISSVTSDPGHDLVPPRKLSLFGVYNESLPSLHSLPNESSSSCVHPDTPRPSSIDVRSEVHPPPAGQGHKKSPGLFSWARERTKSKPSQPSLALPSASSASPSADDSSSFNLRSFRHIGADSPATLPESPPPPSSDSLVPPRPRPRGDSVASDYSQRISVAAFKEAQARSRANSPVPSFRPPSTADTLRVDGSGRKRASTVSVVSATEHTQPNKNAAAAPMPSHRPDSSALDTSSGDSESEDDEEVDSDGEPIPKKPGRKRTITRRADGTHARSDAGHSTAPTPSDQLSPNRQDPPKLTKSAPPLMYQPDQAPFTRPRASVSTSALTPSGAALRASILAGTNSSSSSHVHPTHSQRKLNDDSDESTDSEDTDSEDMPLSGLVAPRRSGSSASNQSNSRPRIPAKPLIDIKSLVGGPPLLTPILRHEDSVKNLSMKRKEQDVEKDQPFSIPVALAHSSSISPPISPSVSKPNTTSVNKPASTALHRKSSNDVPAPKGPENDDDLMNAIRLVGDLDKEVDQPSETSKSSPKSPSNRIVPTPIRAREPPTSFSVLSRPPQRRSTAETSASLSPTWQTPPNSAPPALSPQLETGTRQRAPTVPPARNDKSDAISVSSAARSSTSRSSSRIPPVPLIHSIPDSPSVKEDYKPGRPHSSSRISAVNPSGTRSQPPPTVLISAISSSASSKIPSHGFQPSLMPQRPFASNSSIQGGSPAGSSTGDSSSGRAPFTPRDGSDIGVRSKDDASDVGSTLKARGHVKKSSVTFEDPQPVRGRERAKTDLTDEEKTRERRRSEAKAAIELGKIVNGRRPLMHDDSDEDMGPRGRNPAINVTMDNGANGMMQPGWAAWQQSMGTGMTPMIPPQFGNDPAYIAAHQRALLVAKQAYQMTVAQHAMQMAGDEWERSSNIGFGSGGSVYGGGNGGSVYGGGSGGSIYGGGSGGSVYGGTGGGAGITPMGMMGMPNMGMLMPPNQWARSSVAFPSATASVYGGISSSQSEFGGAGGWGTRSVYGDSSGPSSSRGSGAPNSSASAYGGSSRPRASTGVAPPSTSASSQPTRTPGKSSARNRAAPPSSWKSGR